MKVMAYWKSINPFHPDISRLSYTITFEVPDGTDLGVLEDFARKDTIEGYRFDRLEEIK